MSLENIFRKSEKYFKKTLISGALPLVMLLSSCNGGSSGGGNSGSNSSAGNSPSQTVQTHVVSEGDVVNYSSSTGIINLSYSASNLNQGDIIGSGITSAAPSGFLRKISSMSSDGRTAYTIQESLEDAARDTGKDIRIIINSTLLYPSAVNFSAVKGITPLNLGFPNFNAGVANFVLFDLDGNPSTINDQIIADGVISFDSGFSLVLGADKNGIYDISFKNLISENSSLSISTSSSFGSVNEKIKIANYNIQPFVAGYIPTVPPIPIIIEPQVEVFINLVGSISKIQTSVNQNASLTIGVDYNNGQWSTNNLFSFPKPNFIPPTLPQASSFKASIGPKLNLLFYGIAGPYAEADGHLDFNSNGSSWALYGGLEGKVGVDMQIFKKNFSGYSATVINNSVLLAQSGTSQPTVNTVTIQPGPNEVDDAYVRQDIYADGTISNSGDGSATFLEINQDSAVKEETLVKILVSSIPTNANIISAKLSLYGYCTSNYNVPTITVKSKKILNLWNESSISWNTKPSYDINNSNLVVPDSGVPNWHEWDVTSSVQSWVNGETNYGTALLTTDNGAGCGFNSSDHPDTTKRPKLTISYSQ